MDSHESQQEEEKKRTLERSERWFNESLRFYV